MTIMIVDKEWEINENTSLEEQLFEVRSGDIIKKVIVESTDEVFFRIDPIMESANVSAKESGVIPASYIRLNGILEVDLNERVDFPLKVRLKTDETPKGQRIFKITLVLDRK